MNTSFRQISVHREIVNQSIYHTVVKLFSFLIFHKGAPRTCRSNPVHESKVARSYFPLHPNARMPIEVAKRLDVGTTRDDNPVCNRMTAELNSVNMLTHLLNDSSSCNKEQQFIDNPIFEG